MNLPKRIPGSGQLSEAQAEGLLQLRIRAADALLTHYEMTHGTVGEHDHHCTGKDDTCSCGWSAARFSIERYEEARG